MNAWGWFFFLLPPLLPPSQASSLLFLVCVYFVPFFLTFWFIFGFILPPPPPPPLPTPPPFLFCDTASWDRSGRQPRSHTGQSTSHLNQPLSPPVLKPVNPIMLHSETLPFPTHPTDLPTLQLPRSSFSLLHSPSPMFPFFFPSLSGVQSRENNQWHLWIALTPTTICRIFTIFFFLISDSFLAPILPR